MSQEIFFITTEEAIEVLKDRVRNLERLLMSIQQEEQISAICEKMELAVSYVFDCKHLSTDIKTKKEKQDADAK